jgi:bifunctional non-homologous end joining protein LigD
MAAERTAVSVEGRRLSLSHLDRVLFPGTHTTKAALLRYYGQVAEVMLPHLRGRPASFLRCPDGVEGERFWAKRVPRGAPEWVPSMEVAIKDEVIRYVVITDLAALTWAGNLNAIEIHVPQWRDAPELHDRLIIDLDPGEGTTVLHCCAVALAVRAALAEDGLHAWPRTSGSKGLHLSIPLRPAPADTVNDYARRLAHRLASAHPELIVDSMKKELRRGRVFLDWSQNAGAKTTVAPYSLRARPVPTVATPISWDEVEGCRDPAQLVFTIDQVPRRVEESGDLLAPLVDPAEGQRLPG